LTALKSLWWYRYKLPDTFLLLWLYSSGRLLAFSTVPFHIRRSWTCPAPFYKFQLFQVIPDIIFPSGLGPSYRSSCECFPYVYFLYNTSFRHSIYVSKPAPSLGYNIQGGSNMTGTDWYVNKPHCAAAVRP